MTDMTPKTNDMEKVYLVPKADGSWKTQITDVSPTSDAALLSAEGPYPVKVYYGRIDLNGSSSVEREICHSRADLVQTLNWLGLCGNPILSLWEYDHNQPMSSALSTVLNNSYDRGFRQRQQALAEYDSQGASATLESLISAAGDRADTAVSASFPDREPDR